MRWTGDVDTSSGISEQRFELDVAGRAVPGILWLPADEATRPGPRPLVLAGHGATLHKRVDHIVALAHLLAGGHGFAVAAIDAPGHGDRNPDPDADEVQLFSTFLAEWSRPTSTDDVIAEWAATIDALRDLDEIGDGPLGYWGLSMGTIYGVPLAAAERRIQAAVFGLMGLLGPSKERLATDAASLACPLVFIQQWHDQLVGRDDSFALFDALGSIDKRLHAHPGEHAAVPREELLFSVDFLARHLGP